MLLLNCCKYKNYENGDLNLHKTSCGSLSYCWRSVWNSSGLSPFWDAKQMQ